VAVPFAGRPDVRRASVVAGGVDGGFDGGFGVR
jgi:hypothetical protein